MMRALVGLAIWAVATLGACTFDEGVQSDDDGMGSGSGLGSGSGSGSDSMQDSDGDTVADVADNCPSVNNTDQRNHDSDDFGDACDMCPHVVDLGKDTDGDGVGDGCDPRPTTPGDRIAFFEGFYTDPSWTAVEGGAWTLTLDGAMHQPSVASAFQLVRNDTPNLGKVFIDAKIRIYAVSPNNQMRRATGVVMGYRDANHYMFCGLASATLSVQEAEVQAGQVSTDFFGNPRYDYLPADFQDDMPGDWMIVQATTAPADWGNTHVDCVTHRAGVTGHAAFTGDAGIEGDVGIRTNGADASFDYVFVVAVGT